MNDRTPLFGEFSKGIWKDNPNLVQLLGMCPMLAVTNEVVNALGMGAAITFVLVCSAVFISLIRTLIPGQVRIAAYIVIIAAFVTMADRYMAAFYPSLSKALGPFVPLIVVNCIILGRMEAFAAKTNAGRSALDALGMSIGYGVVMVIISSFREIVGNGTWLGMSVLGAWYDPMMVFVLPAGAFLSLGTLIGVSRFLQMRRSRN
jgi:Na+-translocating ferredoxin:NAD+ oxidoreductase subunit E